MVTDGLLGFVAWLVQMVLSILPTGSLGFDWSPVQTMGEWMGAAAAPIDLPFWLQVVGVFLTAEGVFLAARSTVWIYKRVRGG